MLMTTLLKQQLVCPMSILIQFHGLKNYPLLLRSPKQWILQLNGSKCEHCNSVVLKLWMVI